MATIYGINTNRSAAGDRQGPPILSHWVFKQGDDQFVPLTLDTGAAGGGLRQKRIKWWRTGFFSGSNDDEKPQMIEVKELARGGSGTGLIKTTMVPALAANQYPQKAYQKDSSTINVTMTAPAIRLIVEGT